MPQNVGRELIGLGPAIRFYTTGPSIQNLRERVSARWVGQERMNRSNAQQTTGLGDQDVTIDGFLYPNIFGGLEMLKVIKEAVKLRQPLTFFSINGLIHGRFVLLDLDHRHSLLNPSAVPHKIDFELAMREYGEDGAGSGSPFWT